LHKLSIAVVRSDCTVSGSGGASRGGIAVVR